MAGGSFPAGAHVATISQGAQTSLGGQSAWSGTQTAFTTSRVIIPTAWAGDSVAFRWRMVHDKATADTGWFIDNVTFTSTTALSDPFRPFVSLATSATTLSEDTPGQTATLTLSTPLPLVQGVGVTPDLSGSAGAADLNGPLSFVLPAGQTSVPVAISAFADGIEEGQESLLIAIPSGSAGFAPAPPSSVSPWSAMRPSSASISRTR